MCIINLISGVSYVKLHSIPKEELKELGEIMREIIKSERILHYQRLNMDYRIKKVSTSDNFAGNSLDICITIEVINNIGEDSTKELFNMSPIKLLPTKRPEKFAGEEIYTLKNIYNKV